MSAQYEKFRDKAFSAFREIARECPEFEDAQMLVGSADTKVSLIKNQIYKNIDTEWIDAIEKALPALDVIVRNPSVAIEDVDEVLPVELSRHITDKSIKHLAQHTNLILDIQGDEVTPQKILNVYHDETYLTYENKFINTLLARLSAFVDKRFKTLAEGAGTEQHYNFAYDTEFEHYNSEQGGRNTASISLNIKLTSPFDSEAGEPTADLNRSYEQAVLRVKKIHMALGSYQSSAFVQHMGRNYIRPPVIRTNAILKNKDMKECLTLWEYIEGYDKVGYSIRRDDDVEMPSDQFISDLYSSVALQYVDFYNGVALGDDHRLLSKKPLFETEPEFQSEFSAEEVEEFRVYDSEYKKMVPVSVLMNNRKKMSEDEKRISEAISIALRADRMITQDEERRRIAEEKLAEKRRLAEERRRLAEERRRIEEERLAKERCREEEERRQAEEELARQWEIEQERSRVIAERRRKAQTKAQKKERLVFVGEEAGGNVVFIPYTRQEYAEMSRKRKKQVLSQARRISETKNKNTRES